MKFFRNIFPSKFSPYILFILAISIPITIIAISSGKFFLQNRAQEIDIPLNSTDILNSSDYIPGEVIMKLKQPLSTIQSKPIIRATNLKNLNKNSPSIFSNLHNELREATIENVFKSTNSKPNLNRSPQKEIQIKKTQEELKRVYKLTFDKSKSVPEMIGQLMNDSNVEYAEPNYIHTIESAPNDPYFLDSQPDNVSNRDPNWNPPHDYQWNIKATNSENNWQTDTSNIVVAVIDTGVDITHPELGNVWTNNNEIPNDNIDNDNNGCTDDINGCNTRTNNGHIADDNNHGTHVAGVISARTNNNIGIAGITNNTQIMALKAMDENGSGSTSHIVKAIEYAVDNGSNIISMSLGSYFESQTEKEVVNYATSSNVIVVAAAGNGHQNTNNHYPSSYPSVISVGAVDENLANLEYSNYGSMIDVVAPGGGSPCLYAEKPSYCSNVLSLKSSQNTEDASFVVNEKYLRMSGTSMAAPHVSGIVAFLLAQHPEWLSDELHSPIDYVENYIRFNSTNIHNGAQDEYYGWGVINSSGSVFVEPTNIQFEVRYPAENSIVGDTFNVAGTISADDLDYFIVEYKRENESSWQTSGVTLTNNGTSPIIPMPGKQLYNTAAEIAQIKLPPSSQKGAYEVRTTLFLKSGEKLSSIKKVIYLKKPGSKWWNVNGFLGSSNDSVFPSSGEILIDDINEDGDKEIIIYNQKHINDSNFYLSVYDKNYELLWEVPLLEHEAVIGDIDSTNPGKEIIVQTNRSITYSHDENIFVFDNLGNKIEAMTQNVPSYGGFKANIMVTDADNNGKNELYFYQYYYSSQRRLRVFEQNDQNDFVNKWNYNIDSTSYGRTWPLSGDVNGDGKEEIIIMSGGLLVLDNTGKIIAQGGSAGNKIVLADLNNDGKEEIIITVGKTINALQVSGSNINNLWSYSSNFPTRSLAIADFNHDTYPDIYAYLRDTRTALIISNSGSLILQTRSSLYSSNDYLFENIALADRNNNNFIEAYSTGLFNLDHRGYYDVLEFDTIQNEGKPIDGEWHSLTPISLETRMGVADLDNNGKLDIVLTGFGIVEYDSTGTIYWPHRYGNSQRTGSYQPTSTSVNPSPSPTSFPTATPNPPPPSDFGQALKFDPELINDPAGRIESFILFPKDTKLKMGKYFTIEFWMKPDPIFWNNPNLASNRGFILSKETENNSFAEYSVQIGRLYDKNIVETQAILFNPQGVRSRPWIFGPETNSNDWSYVKVVRNDNKMSLYVNGLLEGQEIILSDAVDDSDDFLTLGCLRTKDFSNCTNSYFGQIDDLRISDIARNDALIPSGPLPVDQNTIALWRFDGNLDDSSQNNLDGTVYGNVDYVDYTYSRSSVINNSLDCEFGNLGNSSCDSEGIIDFIDYSCWRYEYFHTIPSINCKGSDFNSDSKVDLLDFAIWKSGYLSR